VLNSNYTEIKPHKSGRRIKLILAGERRYNIGIIAILILRAISHSSLSTQTKDTTLQI